MKLVVAIVRPEKLNEVLESLFHAEVRGLTINRVQGHGGETVNPTGDIHHAGQAFVKLFQPRIQKIVIRIAHIAAQPASTHELILDRRAVIRKHATKRHWRTAIADDRPQEIQVFPD